METEYSTLMRLAKDMQDVLFDARQKVLRHQERRERECESDRAVCRLFTECWNVLERAVAAKDPDLLQYEIERVSEAIAGVYESLPEPPDDRLPPNMVRFPG
jgi:hypothetical protein